MKKTTVLFTLIFTVMILTASAMGLYKKNSIEKLIITQNDIPQGFVIGKIPRGAEMVFKGNPWYLDQPAIQKLAGRIYPGGDYHRINSIHVTILADQQRPYNDNIVCYVILYRDASGARDEIKKLNDYVGFNNDRAILIPRDNLAVFLLVDDVKDYHLIKAMSETIETRIKEI